jgi:putative SOS response-associated peptidase YedK
MCGRYTLSSPVEVVADLFGVGVGVGVGVGAGVGVGVAAVAGVPHLVPRFNVAPTQPAPVVRVLAPGSPPTLELLRWGLVPYWAQDASIGNRLINARAESAGEKPAFRQSFRKQRCLVVADGFYEWKKEGPVKQPFLIRRQDRLPFAFAGLWARWRDPAGPPPLETFTILTTSPNDLLRPLHDRMPVILDRDAYGPWLDPAASDPDRLHSLLVPAATAGWEAIPVSRAVNNPAHDEPDCIEPLLA